MNASNARNLRMLTAGIAVSVTTAFSGAAGANALLCSLNAPHPNGLAVTDVTFGGSNATDCWGVGTVATEGTNPWVNGIWQLLVTDTTPGDATGASGAAGGVDFSLTTAGTSSGTWQLGWTDTGAPNLPFTMDLVVVLSTGSSFASYLFDNRVFQMDGSGAGAFTLAFNTTSPLSSFAVYQTDLRALPQVTPQAVPEPSMLLLLGVGLVGLSATRLRRHRQD